MQARELGSGRCGSEPRRICGSAVRKIGAPPGDLLAVGHNCSTRTASCASATPPRPVRPPSCETPAAMALRGALALRHRLGAPRLPGLRGCPCPRPPQGPGAGGRRLLPGPAARCLSVLVQSTPNPAARQYSPGQGGEVLQSPGAPAPRRTDGGREAASERLPPPQDRRSITGTQVTRKSLSSVSHRHRTRATPAATVPQPHPSVRS